MALQDLEYHTFFFLSTVDIIAYQIDRKMFTEQEKILLHNYPILQVYSSYSKEIGSCSSESPPCLMRLRPS